MTPPRQPGQHEPRTGAAAAAPASAMPLNTAIAAWAAAWDAAGQDRP